MWPPTETSGGWWQAFVRSSAKSNSCVTFHLCWPVLMCSMCLHYSTICSSVFPTRRASAVPHATSSVSTDDVPVTAWSSRQPQGPERLQVWHQIPSVQASATWSVGMPYEAYSSVPAVGVRGPCDVAMELQEEEIENVFAGVERASSAEQVAGGKCSAQSGGVAAACIVSKNRFKVA